VKIKPVSSLVVSLSKVLNGMPFLGVDATRPLLHEDHKKPLRYVLAEETWQIKE